MQVPTYATGDAPKIRRVNQVLEQQKNVVGELLPATCLLAFCSLLGEQPDLYLL